MRAQHRLNTEPEVKRAKTCRVVSTQVERAGGQGNFVTSDEKQEVIISDNDTYHSMLSNQQMWSEVLNMNFSTQIFTKSSDYICELSNIYAARAQIDASLSKLMPNFSPQNKHMRKHVERLIEALDDMKVAIKRCTSEMETQRQSMYRAAKQMIMLRDDIRRDLMNKKEYKKVSKSEKKA